jgi:plasmanylethanolamine desaturase
MDPLSATIFITAITAQVVLCIAIAEFIAGAVHWAEDRYGSPDTPLIGASVIAPNLLHHQQPRAFLANSWWRSADIQILGALITTGATLVLGVLTWRVLLVLAIAVNVNEVHKWAHRTKAENGRLITFLQAHGVLQSRAHHNRHHGGQRDSHYCSLTPWMNPILERLRIWRGLEWMIARVTGVLPRRG